MRQLIFLALASAAICAHAAEQDRFMAGASVSVAAPLAGDLFAAGGEVDVAADIGGDAVVAGGSVRIANTVGQDIYAAAGRVAFRGTVERNARVAAGHIEVGPRARIAGNASFAAGNVRILGTIGGDVHVASGELELGPNARIEGNLRYAGGELRRDPTAYVGGSVERLEPPAPPMQAREGFRAAGWAWSIGLLVLAAVLAAALPGVYRSVAATVRSRWAASLLIGFIALVCIPAAAIIAMITLIGIPIALVAMTLYLALLLAGYVSAGISLGQLALQRFNSALAMRTSWRIAAAVLGTLAISLLGRVPWLGGLVILAALLLGTGALLTQLKALKSPPGSQPG